MNKILNSLLLSSSVIVTVSGNNIDCEYSFCQEAFTSTDCQELATKCAGYGGLPSCNVGDFEFECNDIDLTGSGSTCTTDATALTLCSAYSYDDIATCSQTEGDCDTTPSVTSAPTPAGAVTTIDCSYDACTLPLTSTDCTSLTNQCAANGGVAFCVPGDNEFECNNIAYTGAGACTDGTATSQCVGYDYTGYTCTDNEGDCDDPALATFAPTPAADRTVPMIDCDYEECTTVLTSDDCSEISASCSALGGVSFCAVGSSEFECNNIPWGGSQGCTDELAEATCLTYSFPSAGECLDKDGDCSSTSTSGDDGDDELSDGELAAIAILVPILLVMVGCAVWYVLSKRAAENDKPPMASQERESTSSAL